MKEKVIIALDTTCAEETVVSLSIGERKIEERRPRGIRKEQEVLVMIDKLLKKEGITLTDISEIHVNPGPGSFTGTRVGVAIANTLGFCLSIKVNGQEPPIDAQYT